MGDVEMTGPAVRVMLTPEQRDQFDAEFEQTLPFVASSLDPEPLAALIRRWWVTGGGDPEVAEADRFQQEELRHASRILAGPENMKVCIPCTGPVVFENLPDHLKSQFEGEWKVEVEATANTFDVRHLQRFINNYWGFSLLHVNPEAEAEVHRIAAATEAEELAAAAAEYNQEPP